MIPIFLLTGWGVGVKPLFYLADALTTKNYQVILSDLPYSKSAKNWLKTLSKQLPEKSYWVGWSLGGQLLSQLTQLAPDRCLGLVTLASNVCFKEKADWMYAMKADIFNEFQLNYQSSPEQTLKRFLYLVAQGSKDPRTLVKILQQFTQKESGKGFIEGLNLLATLDTRAALEQFSKPQYHLFGMQDLLVPASSANALKPLLPHALIEMVEKAGHGFPIEDYNLVANKIDRFIKGSL